MLKKIRNWCADYIGQNENETSKDRAVPPTVVFEPPVEEGQQKEEARVPKMSLPARMSDLYQVTQNISNFDPNTPHSELPGWCRGDDDSSRYRLH